MRVSVQLFSIILHAQETKLPKFTKEGYRLRTYDGKEHEAEFYTLYVKEYPKDTKSKEIQVKFVRLPSKSSSLQYPIIFLAGGPGIPGIGIAQVPVYFSLFEKLQQDRDVILLDQRGTGLSTPNLQLRPAQFSNAAFKNEKSLVFELASYVKKNADSLRKAGIDLSGYTTLSISEDIELIRQILKAKRISLLGWSFGTEAALAYINHYPQNIDKIVMCGTRGPDNIFKLPSVWDMQLKKLSWLASRDTAVHDLIPDMEATLKKVLFKLEKTPIELEIFNKNKNEKQKIVVGKIGLQTILRNDIGNEAAIEALPAFIYALNREDYSGLSKKMEAIYNNFSLSLMGLCVDCASGVSPQRASVIRTEIDTSVMSNVNLQWSDDVCSRLGIKRLDAEYKKRTWCSSPALFITGTLDINTPVFQAEEIRMGFPNSKHVIVEHGGHETIPIEQVQKIIADFLNDSQTIPFGISLQKLKFNVPK